VFIAIFYGVKMNQPWNIIQLLEDDNSRLGKESIILANKSNTEFFAGAKLALDSMITFGLKQIPEKTDTDGPGLDWASFNNAVQLFVNRACTGNAARDVVVKLMDQATKEQWNDWYRRILIKDLRCGASEKTINKVVKDSIPIFSCQLAHDSANHESKVAGQKLIEVKLDGVRVITIAYPSGRVDQYSRNGKELVNFPHLKEQLARVAAGFTEPMVLDGEVMSTSFQDLMKQVHRKDNVNAKDALLYLFDAVPLVNFEKGKCNTPQSVRSQWLKDWYNSNIEALPNFRTLAQELVDLDTDVGQKRFRAINQQAIDGGYEGIMIKDTDAPYECDRTVSWLKLKPFIDVSLKAVAIEEGTGKNVGRMGAVVFEGADDDKFIRVSCGGGWSDQQRAAIWASHTGQPVAWEKRVKGIVTTIIEQPGETVIGNIGEVRADGATKNQDSDNVWSLRFPRFKIWRGFVAGEKL
jgi:DNA ligase 1